MITNEEILKKHKSILDDYTYRYGREDVYDMRVDERAKQDATYKNKIVKELGLYDKLEAIVHISVKDIRYKMFDRYRKELAKKFKVD